MRSWSLRSRLFLLIILPLVFVAAIAGLARFVLAERMSERLYDKTLLVTALTISRDVILSEGDVLAEQLLDRLTNSLGDPVYYRIVGPGGRFVTGYSDAPERPKNGDTQTGVPVFYDSHVLGQKVRAVSLEEFISEPQFGGWVTVQVWQTVRERDNLSRLLFYQSISIMGVVISAAAMLVWFGIRLGLKPLTDLQEAVQLRSPDDLHPIRRGLPIEIRGVVGAMNSLFSRLERAFAQRDAFIADAAHQLRNPVAAIQAQTESLTTALSEEDLRRRIGGLVQTARLTGRLTQQLLTLEKARTGLSPDRRTEIDLPRIARVVTAKAAELHSSQPVDVTFETDGQPAPVFGDAVLVEEAVTNLVDNAFLYGSKEGGTISVSIEFVPGKAILTVEDTGPGIPPALRERVFDRFFRAGEQAGEGSGLGLPIARSIAEAHGGSVKILDSKAGTRVALCLPTVR
jgi:two-component system sensor histidine kinase TctE